MGLLDISAPSAGAQNGTPLQLDALHSLAVQHHRLLLAVVEPLVPIPDTWHEASYKNQAVASVALLLYKLMQMRNWAACCWCMQAQQGDAMAGMPALCCQDCTVGVGHAGCNHAG